MEEICWGIIERRRRSPSGSGIVQCGTVRKESVKGERSWIEPGYEAAAVGIPGEATCYEGAMRTVERSEAAYEDNEACDACMGIVRCFARLSARHLVRVKQCSWEL